MLGLWGTQKGRVDLDMSYDDDYEQKEKEDGSGISQLTILDHHKLVDQSFIRELSKKRRDHIRTPIDDDQAIQYVRWCRQIGIRSLSGIVRVRLKMYQKVRQFLDEGGSAPKAFVPWDEPLDLCSITLSYYSREQAIRLLDCD